MLKTHELWRKEGCYIISEKILIMMYEVDSGRTVIDLLMLDGTYNVQKAGQIMAQHYTCVTITHFAALVVSFMFGEMVKLELYCDMSKFCQIVCNDIFYIYL